MQPIVYTTDPRNRCTILLVEDEPFVREATSALLEQAGYCVLPAADARDAMRVFENSNRNVDLVMTDLVLPGCTGQELAEDFLRRSPKLRILITSGYDIAEYATEDPSTQTYFLAKPYSQRALVQKIEMMLDARTLGQSASQAS